MAAASLLNKVEGPPALHQFMARQEQARIVELFGTLEWDASYNVKAERSRS